VRKNSSLYAYTLVALSVFFACCILILPLPRYLSLIKPDLLCLVLIYWVANLQERDGISLSFITGILVDLLTGVTLGVNAFSFSLMAFLTINMRMRLRLYGVSSQILVVCFLVTVNRISLLLFMLIINKVKFSFINLLPIVATIGIWPLVYTVLSNYQKNLRIS